ncbi:MAG: hypothetical protein RMJ57_08725 [Bacteroidia bacterium]|nr:hypothetical protein [Bacteroidia bacterium]
MSTWRNWLRTFLPWTAREEKSSLYPLPTQAAPEPPPQPTKSLQRELNPENLYPILPVKQWALSRISPYAWDRAILRSLPTLQRSGIPLSSLLAPQPDTRIPGSALQQILHALEETYGTSISLDEIFNSERI